MGGTSHASVRFGQESLEHADRNERIQKDLDWLYAKKECAAADYIATLTDEERGEIDSVLNEIGEGFGSLKIVSNDDLPKLKIIIDDILSGDKPKRKDATRQLNNLVS